MLGGEESWGKLQLEDGAAGHCSSPKPNGGGCYTKQDPVLERSERGGPGAQVRAQQRELLQEDRGVPRHPPDLPLPPHRAPATPCSVTLGTGGGSSSEITPALEVTMSREKGPLPLTLSSRLGIWSLCAGPSPAQRRILSLHSQWETRCDRSCAWIMGLFVHWN